MTVTGKIHPPVLVPQNIQARAKPSRSLNQRQAKITFPLSKITPLAYRPARIWRRQTCACKTYPADYEPCLEPTVWATFQGNFPYVPGIHEFLHGRIIEILRSSGRQREDVRSAHCESTYIGRIWSITPHATHSAIYSICTHSLCYMFTRPSRSRTADSGSVDVC